MVIETKNLKNKIEMVMIESTIPQHYLDIEEAIFLKFNTKYTSLENMKIYDGLIEIIPSVYIHKSNLTDIFYIKFNELYNKIASNMLDIINHTKLPIPLKCFIYYFTGIKKNKFLTKNTLKEVVLDIINRDKVILKNSKSEIISKKINYNMRSNINYNFKSFCRFCVVYDKKFSKSTDSLLGNNCKFENLNFKINNNITSYNFRNIINYDKVCNDISSANNLTVIDNRKFDTYESSEKICSTFKKVNDEFYVEIMNSNCPENLISDLLFNEWKNLINSSNYCDKLMVDVANEINLNWPTVRHDEKISNYLILDFDSIKKIPAFGRKKTRILILCLTHAAFKANPYSFSKIINSNYSSNSVITFDELLISESPHHLIDNQTWSNWCSSLKNSPLISTKIVEISSKHDLVWTYTKRDEIISNFIDLTFQELLNLPKYGPKKIRTIILSIASLVIQTTSQHQNIPDPSLEVNTALVTIEDINELIKIELSKLSEREQLVINRRYGLAGFEPVVLEEIGREFNLTRERVRQILKKIVAKLRFSPNIKQISIMIKNLNIELLWEKLTNNHGIILKQNVNREFEKLMPGEFLLALECCELSIEEWLSMSSYEGERAWYLSQKKEQELEDIIKKLKCFISQSTAPLPIATIQTHFGVSYEIVASAIYSSSDYKIFDGYVFQGRIGARARRAAHLHQILNWQETFLPLQDLVALHNKQYPSEVCSTRDADLVMRESPHLFVLLGDNGWCSIGYYHDEKIDPPIVKEILNDFDLRIEQVTVDEEATVTSIVISILQSRGISNFTDIVKEFKEIVGNDYSEYSVGPMLLIRDEFIKLAPSIYGLREHFKNFKCITSNLLLNEYDVQLYIMARYAGEKFGSFPLWNAAMEYNWYKWIEKHSNIELTESFYSVATPDEWPVNNEHLIELKYKLNQKNRAYYFLREPIYNENNFPDIRSLYSLIRYTKDNLSINWISANRVLGRRINDYHTVIEIAFLVCFGIVDPADNWQKLHHAKKDAEYIEKKLSILLHCGKGDSWKSPAGDLLIDLFTLNINSVDIGWVDISAMNKLFYAESKVIVDSITTDYYSSKIILEEDSCIHENAKFVGKTPPSNVEETVSELFLLLDDDDTIILN